MEFPVHITFKMLGWRADLRLSDAAGRTMAYVQSAQIRDGRLPVYADEGMGAPIYTIKAEHPFTQWFEDAAGTKVGQFGLTPLGMGKYIFVGSEPRFRLVDASPWLDFADRIIPSVPVVNGLTGAIVRPRTDAIRIQSGPDEHGVIEEGACVLRMIKKRMMIDIRYTLDALDETTERERECLILSAMIYALQDHTFKAMQ